MKKLLLRKLALSRETVRALEGGSLKWVGGGTILDTRNDCSTDCDLPTDIYHACG